MKVKQKEIIKSILGDDIFDDLKKYEIYKPETKTVLDPVELRVALEIVPRSILSFVYNNLQPLSKGQNTTLELPFCVNGQLNVVKHGADNYNGDIVQDGKVLVSFLNRSLPSIGLIILTTFELYDLNHLTKPAVLEEPQQKQLDFKLDKLQNLIDERLQLHALIKDVVDKRLSEREAINRLIQDRLHESVVESKEENEELDKECLEESEECGEPIDEVLSSDLDIVAKNKKNKLKQFLDKRKQVGIYKKEIKCSDCKTVLYKSSHPKHLTLCVCYGQHRNTLIKVEKKEGNFRLKFPKNFELENIEMLLDTLKHNKE